MKKQLGIPVLGICLCVLALILGPEQENANGFTLEEYHNADAKFVGDQIITSVDEGIQLLDLNGQVQRTFDGLSASWIYVEASTDTIAYSNHENETHILRLPEEADGEVTDTLAVSTDLLAIDPILVKTEDGWLLTHTTIDGTINNPSPDGDNGIYTVKLYRSEDLEQWEFVTDIISRKQNLEDGDIRYVDGVLYYFFEMEDYDKGPSKICVKTSEDLGLTWSEEKVLLPNIADNEMASCEPTDTGWRLYVSSDKDCAGESYQGAKVYYSDYTPDFEPIQTYQLSAMPDNESVRLYEAREEKDTGQMQFLFARNFLTDCDLLFRTIEKEE
jgi:hypothetical protein